MNKLNIFKKGSTESSGTRRSFVKTSLAAILGATALAKTTDLFAMKSKTGLLYVKENGEVINNYSPMGGSQDFLGQLNCVAFSFAPQGWSLCNGQLMPIAQNSALFSLLGTTYGGDGVTTFALPDLRGRVPIHFGQGPGLTNRVQGSKAGEEAHVLLSTEMPGHTHGMNVNNSIGTGNTPGGNFLAQNSEGINEYSAAANASMNSTSIGLTGGNLGHNNMQPYLVLNWIIAMQGIFPSQP